MNSVPCLAWVRQGVAQKHPEKVKLTEEELSKIIQKSEQALENMNLEDDSSAESGDENADMTTTTRKRKKPGQSDDVQKATEAASALKGVGLDEIEQKYGLDDYDEDEANDDEGAMLGMGGITMFSNNNDDPYLTKDEPDESDEDEDLLVLPEDNMIAIGKVHANFCNLEVYLYTEQDSNLYCHHDIILPTFPLCLEWMSFDPSESKTGNFVAMGSMSPDIDIWDLDTIDAVEPAFTLAGTIKQRKKNKKKKTVVVGHTDAVLGLSWNKHLKKVLASASADFTVGIWDLTEGKMVSNIKHHNEKVQTVQWHPVEHQMLLSGSFDKTAKVYDCRSSEQSHKSWTLPGEVEKVLWNHNDPFYFLASSDTGDIYYLDVRTEEPVFTLNAHQKAVTGLSLSSSIPGCLVTCSEDKMVKVWDISSSSPKAVFQKNMKMGQLNCISCSPDSPLIYAVGGERELRILNLRRNEEVTSHFGIQAPELKGDEAQDDEEVGCQDAGDDEEEREFGLMEEAAAPPPAQKSKDVQKRKKVKSKKKAKKP